MLKGILAISGHSGLFKLVAESKNSIIVESLDTNKRFPVHAANKVSSLEDISVFTIEGDIALSKVFKAIHDKENGGKIINLKMPDKNLKSYFGEVLPDFDKDKVYVSDIKKILAWYNILLEKNLLEFAEDSVSEKDEISNSVTENNNSEQS